ncbi:MAG: hypothetical protein ABFD16_16545 [Thermoguttaceae bacterium]
MSVAMSLIRTTMSIVAMFLAALVVCRHEVWAADPEKKPEAKSPAPAASDEPSAESLPENVSGPRDLLRFYEIDKSHFARLTDGNLWQEGENELLFRIMFRLRDFRLMDIERWARPLVSATELAAKPDDARGEFFRLQGRVTSVTLCQPLSEIVDRFEMKPYYRCDLLLGEQRQVAIVFTQTIPQAWKPDQPIDERAGGIGMFLKLASADAQQPTPIFVAPRVAWYPNTVLGDLGMDYGLFDDLKPEEPDGQQGHAVQSKLRSPRDLDALRLTSRTAECFYQMLAAAKRARPGELAKMATDTLQKTGQKSFSVVPLFNQPDKQHGQLVVLSGTARLAIPVRVSEDDILARFGLKEYYQLFLFTDDSQGNPLVVCVPRLPKGMPSGEDRSYAEHVTVAGFFFNTWAYRNRDSGQGQGQSHWQLAPLLIGQEPVWHPRPAKSTNLVSSVVFGVLFVLAFGGICVALWISRRGDKEFREKVLANQASSSPVFFNDRDE